MSFGPYEEKTPLMNRSFYLFHKYTPLCKMQTNFFLVDGMLILDSQLPLSKLALTPSREIPTNV